MVISDHGEIKGLGSIGLTVRTLDLGNCSNPLAARRRLNSNRTLEIEPADGRRLQDSWCRRRRHAGRLRRGGTVPVHLASIVVIRPVARSWIGDLTGRTDAGFSYTRGSQRRPGFGQCRDNDGALRSSRPSRSNEVRPRRRGSRIAPVPAGLHVLSLLDRTRVRRGPC